MRAQIILMVAGAFLGAVLSAALPLVIATVRYRKKKKLLGSWKSQYQSEFPPRGKWVSEEVKVISKQGSLIFTNLNNPESQYTAQGRFQHHDIEIAGLWSNTEEGAHACGTFHLFVHPMGHILYGLCSGSTDTGERLYTGWVLARKEEDLPKAHQLLNGADLLLVSQPT